MPYPQKHPLRALIEQEERALSKTSQSEQRTSRYGETSQSAPSRERRKAIY
jgi:hypothetical protein